jgi:hypothetical protein
MTLPKWLTSEIVTSGGIATITALSSPSEGPGEGASGPDPFRVARNAESSNVLVWSDTSWLKWPCWLVGLISGWTTIQFPTHRRTTNRMTANRTDGSIQFRMNTSIGQEPNRFRPPEDGWATGRRRARR